MGLGGAGLDWAGLGWAIEWAGMSCVVHWFELVVLLGVKMRGVGWDVMW